MDAWELLCTAEYMLKNCEQWDEICQIEPSFWESESYKDAACLAQAILMDNERLKYLLLRRKASRKRSSHRERE